MKGSLNLDGGNWSMGWKFKIELDNTGNRVIFEMLYPAKISSYYSLAFANVSTPTTYRQMFLHEFEISKGENIILDNSEINFLKVDNCSNMKIVNSIIKKRLFLYRCINLEIENCNIHKFHVSDTNQNIEVKNSIIKKVTEGSEAHYVHIE